jgi:sulfur carrier protein
MRGEGVVAQASIRVNGEQRLYREGTVLDLLRDLGRDPARPGIAVAIGGVVIPRKEWASRRVEPGDDVELVGATQGG